MHRFFLLDTPITSGQIVDLSSISHQLTRVLRLTPGEEIVLLDNQNFEYLTEITALERRQATGRVLSRQPVHSEPTHRLTLYQCSLKADKFEWVLQKGTELGVSRFVPVISERSVVRPASALLKKYDRWQAILREAAEQSGRGRLPLLGAPMSFDTAVAQATGDRYLPWEEAERDTISGLGQAVTASASAGPDDEISLLIGPEGGIAVGEAASATGAGWQTTTLGPRILRAETAALTAVTIVMDRLNELGR
jgi:16S rRNA (uracil1498-N3)-methyltransferase